MNYSNISVNSAEYSKLSKLDKIKVINSKLNSLFNSGEKNNVTVIYKGQKKSIPSNMLGKYKDLCEREKKLKKGFLYDIDYDFDDSSDDGSALSHASEYFVVPSSNSLIDRENSSNETAKKGASGFVAPDRNQFIIDIKEPSKEVNYFETPKVDELATEKKTPVVEAKKETGFKVPSMVELIDVKKESILNGERISGFKAPEVDDLAKKNTSDEVKKTNYFETPKVDELATEKKTPVVEAKKETGFKVPAIDDFVKKNASDEVKKTNYFETPKVAEIVTENKTSMVENKIEVKSINKLLEEIVAEARHENELKQETPVVETKEINSFRTPGIADLDKKKTLEEVKETSKIDEVITEKKVQAVETEHEEEVNRCPDGTHIDDEDFTAVWESAFRKRDLALGRKEKNNTVSIKAEVVDKTYRDYKNGDDDEDLSLFWGTVFDNAGRKKEEDTDAFKAEIVNDVDEEVETEKTNKKGLFAGILAIPFIKKMKDKKKESKVVSKSGKYDKKNKNGLFAGILAIPFIKKIRDNRKVVLNPIEDRTNKKRNLKIAAIAIALAATTVICSVIPGLSKKKNRGIVKGKTSETIVYEDPSVIEPPIEDIVIDNPDKEKEENNIDNKNENVVVDSNIYFDDKVIIEDNSYIYYSSYDAASESNCLNPLYSGSYERDVMGVVYSLEGNIYTIYSSDPDAYMKAEELIEQGAKQEAVLVTRSDLVYTGQYEGYYNIDDVKVLTRVR